MPIETDEGARYVLITHRHPDHFDKTAATRALGSTGTVMCAPDAAPSVAAAGFKVRPVPLYEPQLVGEFTATAGPRGRRIWRPAGLLGRERRRPPDHPLRRHPVARLVVAHRASARPLRRRVPAHQRRALRLAEAGERRRLAVLTPEQAVAAAVILGARLLVADPLRHGGVGRVPGGGGPRRGSSATRHGDAASTSKWRRRGVADLAAAMSRYSSPLPSAPGRIRIALLERGVELAVVSVDVVHEEHDALRVHVHGVVEEDDRRAAP